MRTRTALKDCFVVHQSAMAKVVDVDKCSFAKTALIVRSVFVTENSPKVISCTLPLTLRHGLLSYPEQHRRSLKGIVDPKNWTAKPAQLKVAGQGESRWGSGRNILTSTRRKSSWRH